MVRGPMGALACSEWGTRSCTDIPCWGEEIDHNQIQPQGEPCLGLKDMQVRDGAAGLLSWRTVDRPITAQGQCPHKGLLRTHTVCGEGR